MARPRFAYVFAFVCSNAAACELPALPVVPASVGDDVASVLLDVRRYSDSLIDYVACLKDELAAAGGDAAPTQVRSILVGRNNYAVAEHKAVTDLYVARVGTLENLRLAEYLDGETRDCLFGSSIANTGVVNKGAVIFFLRGGTAYLNVLEATCGDLEREDGFFVGEQSATGVGVNPASRGAIGPTGDRRKSLPITGKRWQSYLRGCAQDGDQHLHKGEHNRPSEPDELGFRVVRTLHPALALGLPGRAAKFLAPRNDGFELSAGELVHLLAYRSAQVGGQRGGGVFE